jgi:hypothetical protein
LSNLLIRLRDYRHGWAHRLGWATGYVVSGWSGDALWIGFRCTKCDRITGAHVAEHRYPGAVLSKESLTPPRVWQR